MKQHLKLIVSVCAVVVLAIVVLVFRQQIFKPNSALSVQVTPKPTGPRVVASDPVAGQRLPPTSASVQITFDRSMDRAKTLAAFEFQDADGNAVKGQAAWVDDRTLSFAPGSPLRPSSIYHAVVSTAASSADGLAPDDAIKVEFMTAESLQVTQVFPLADASDLDQSTTVTVIFNHPVVPVAIREQAGLPQPVELTPQVNGRGTWVSSSVYVFQPDHALIGGTRYTVRVGSGLKDTLGNSLEKSFVSQFTTRSPGIENFLVKNGASNPPLDNVQNILLDQEFLVTFQQPMDPVSVGKALTITNRETRAPVPLKLTWDKEATVLTIQPSGRYAIGSFYDLRMTDQAQASDGSFLKSGLTVNFSTVPLPSVVRIMPPRTDKGFDGSLGIQFASPMRLDSLKGRVVITPAPASPLQWYYSDYDWSYRTYGLDPGTQYVVRVLPGMTDIYGNAIRTETSLNFSTADMPPYARLVMPYTPLVYRAKGPQEAYFEYTNAPGSKVALYPLTFDEFTNIQRMNDPTAFHPSGALIREWKADPSVAKNRLGRLHVKLQDQKGNALGPGYYLLGVTGSELQYSSNFYQTSLIVIATDNITLKATPTEALAWVVDLETGKPQSGAEVTFYNKDFKQTGKPITTDSNGLAYLKDIDGPLYARLGGMSHLAFVGTNWGSGVWAGDLGIEENYYNAPSSSFAYIYTDRPVYRPGQDVFFKGLVRQNDDLHYSLLKEKQVFVTIEEAGERVYEKNLSMSQLGSIADVLKLSSDAALGTYSIQVRTKAGADPFASLDFRVAEYHKPTFRVAASADKAAVLRGEQVQFQLDGSYYSGGNVAGAKTDWFTQASPYTFTPAPKYSRFSFADWDRDMYLGPQQSNPFGGTLAEGHATTDAAGHLAVPQVMNLGETKADAQVTFSANVSDVAGDLVSGQTTVVVHQSLLYAGIRAMSYIGTAGQAQPVEVVVLDWDSRPVGGQAVTVQFVERKWFSVQKQDKQGQLSWMSSVKDIPVGQQTIKTGDDGTAQVSFMPQHGGVYKAIVTVTDAKGNKQQSSTYTWIAGNEYIPWRQTNDRSFNLIADKDNYTPGDTAELMIAQPIKGSVYALVTYERGHIYKQEVVLLNGNSTIYKLPISADMAPVAYVSVVVVSGADNTGSPDFKIGMARLNVDTSQQALDVKVTSDKSVAGPNDTVTYTVTTKDQAGKPVSADVSLAVADKAALALAPSNSGRILDSFYPFQALGVQTALGLVSNAEDFNAQYRESIPEGGGSGGGGEDSSYGIITVRQNFKDTAFFQAELTTDENGQAQVSVKLPENLTTWVADARAATIDGHVGQATSEMVSSKPLLVELQTPRFFVAGDAARIGAVVHNNQAEPLKVDVKLDADGVQLMADAAQSVSVDAKSQAYVTWDVRVKEDASRVDLTATAVSGAYSDASKPALGTLPGQGIPVQTYSAVETVGTSGILSRADTATEAIQLPTTYEFTDAKLSVDVSPSLAASMQDGLTYLKDYPYMCMEQTVSSFLPNVLTTRALKLAGISDPDLKSSLDVQVNQALQRIYVKQKPDGGWNWWDGDTSDPQTSAYVVFALLEAKESGYPVTQSVLTNGLQYLKLNLPNLYQNAAKWEYNRFAFMSYVLARAGELQPGQTNFIYEHRDALSVYGQAYLAQAIFMLKSDDTRLDTLKSDLANAAVLSAAGAHWEEKGYNDYWNWNTDLRTTAIVLNAMIQLDPKNPLTANAVRWLMAQRQSGHWNSTQETAWSLMALTNWLTASKEYESSYQYAVGLNGASLEQGKVTKENLAKTVQVEVQNKDLLKDVLNYLVITRGAGNGNLYYDAYLRTTLPVESVEPLDQGASLTREYFSLGDPKHPITEIRRGDLVRVRLTIVVPAALHYVVIDDPLPAGLEAIDSSILTDTQVPAKYTVQDYNERGWGWWYFSHIERRDEKIVLSTDTLPAGTYVYTYLARASTIGTYKVIPPTAAEFYFPDVGGRGAGSQFVVKP